MAINVLPPDEAKKRARAKVKEWKRKEGLKAKIAARKLDPDLEETKPYVAREKSELNAMLFTAIKDCDLQKVKEALDSGAEINARDCNGNTPLILACYYGDIGILTPTTKSAIQPERNRRAEHARIVGIGAKQGDRTGMVSDLINANADINYQNECGETALMVSSFQSDTKYVLLLLSAGADPNLRDNENFTALGYVLEKRSKHTDKDPYDFLADQLRKAGGTE